MMALFQCPKVSSDSSSLKRPQNLPYETCLLIRVSKCQVVRRPGKCQAPELFDGTFRSPLLHVLHSGVAQALLQELHTRGQGRLVGHLLLLQRTWTLWTIDQSHCCFAPARDVTLSGHRRLCILPLIHSKNNQPQRDALQHGRLAPLLIHQNGQKLTRALCLLLTPNSQGFTRSMTVKSQKSLFHSLPS